MRIGIALNLLEISDCSLRVIERELSQRAPVDGR
jgi:hypothetical protein